MCINIYNIDLASICSRPTNSKCIDLECVHNVAFLYKSVLYTFYLEFFFGIRNSHSFAMFK